MEGRPGPRSGVGATSTGARVAGRAALGAVADRGTPEPPPRGGCRGGSGHGAMLRHKAAYFRRALTPDRHASQSGGLRAGETEAADSARGSRVPAVSAGRSRRRKGCGRQRTNTALGGGAGAAAPAQNQGKHAKEPVARDAGGPAPGDAAGRDTAARLAGRRLGPAGRKAAEEHTPYHRPRVRRARDRGGEHRPGRRGGARRRQERGRPGAPAGRSPGGRGTAPDRPRRKSPPVIGPTRPH